MSQVLSPYQKIADELEWLKNNPQFEERPATLTEFLGPEYLNCEKFVRPRIREELANIMGHEVMTDRPTLYPLAMITGGIGIGKTTVASIVLPYLCHWVLCLKDPQAFFGLLPGSRIAFMQMSTSEKQALEVIFGDIKARVKHSPWFDKYPMDPNYRNQIRFEKDIWILPGDSAETTFEGYNILGGILDEADSHKITKNKDYAEQGYSTIESRISSRFDDKGFLMVIGQMKSGSGFAARKFEEFRTNPKAYAVRLAIWESRGFDYYKNPDGTPGETFFYDTSRKRIIPSAMADVVVNQHLVEIPAVYLQPFTTNPEKALRDLAGIPPITGDTFISLGYKITEARDRWNARYGKHLGSPLDEDGKLASWFHAPDTLKRVAHIDIAYSGDGDALGFCMGHVQSVVEIEGEMKPYIVIDLLIRVHAAAGGEIFLADIRRFIYGLREDRGFRLAKVTMDGFESTDTDQQLRKRRFETEYVSVDRQILPYHDLREAIYEDRIEFPPYYVNLRKPTGVTERVEIVVKELMELQDNVNKIDHPPDGSKDVADALAGVTYTLMGDRRYRKGIVNLGAVRQQRAQVRQAVGFGTMSHPAYLGDQGLSAPLPPTTNSSVFGPRN